MSTHPWSAEPGPAPLFVLADRYVAGVLAARERGAEKDATLLLLAYLHEAEDTVGADASTAWMALWSMALCRLHEAVRCRAEHHGTTVLQEATALGTVSMASTS